MSIEEQNMNLMQTLDDAWNAQDLERFAQRHKPDTVVRERSSRQVEVRSRRWAVGSIAGQPQGGPVSVLARDITLEAATWPISPSRSAAMDTRPAHQRRGSSPNRWPRRRSSAITERALCYRPSALTHKPYEALHEDPAILMRTIQISNLPLMRRLYSDLQGAPMERRLP